MKTKIAALSLLLLAVAAGAALAQDGRRDHEPRGHVGPGDRPARAMGRDLARPPRPAEPPRAQEAPSAPSAPEASGERRRRFDGAGPGREMGRGRWVDREGDRGGSGLTGADRQDREDRTEARDARRWQGGEGRRDGARRWDGDERRGGDDGRDRAERRDGERRWDGDRDGRRDGDRRWDGDRDRRGPPANHPRWERRRYPPVYTSQHRYRGHIWRAPVGFYVHSWSFGEVLPRGWYDAPYLLTDWWDFGLPAPPPGYDWVRVGYDALLVDRWSGRVLQVVRAVFW